MDLNSEPRRTDDQMSTEVRALVQLQQDAWNRADLETSMQGYWHSLDLTFA